MCTGRAPRHPGPAGSPDVAWPRRSPGWAVAGAVVRGRGRGEGASRMESLNGQQERMRQASDTRRSRPPEAMNTVQSATWSVTATCRNTKVHTWGYDTPFKDCSDTDMCPKHKTKSQRAMQVQWDVLASPPSPQLQGDRGPAWGHVSTQGGQTHRLPPEGQWGFRLRVMGSVGKQPVAWQGSLYTTCK